MATIISPYAQSYPASLLNLQSLNKINTNHSWMTEMPLDKDYSEVIIVHVNVYLPASTALWNG